MKTVMIAPLALAACLALPGWAGAQNPQQQSEPAQTPSMPDAPGMNMGAKPQQPAPKNMRMPADMRQPSSEPQANPPAAKASESLRNSERQQMPQMNMRPGQNSDAQSATHPTMTLQEPENPDYHTGENLPAPELLNDVAKRAPLSLRDFEDWAEALNPTLSQAREEVRRSEQQGRQAGLYPNPTLAYDAEHIRGGSYGAGEQGAYVQQQFVLGGKLRLRRDVYRQESAGNRIGVEEQEFRVRASLRQAYYRALTSQAEVILRQRMLRVTEDAVATAHQLSNVGQADAPDVLQSEVEAEQAKVDFVQAQRQFLSDFRALSAVANKPELAPSPLQGDLENPPKIDPEQQLAAIGNSSPEVRRALQEVKVAEARLRDARREPIPDLTLRAGEWWSGEFTEGTQRAAGPMSFATASMDLPLWNRNQGNIEAAKAELDRAREDVTRTRLRLEQEAEPLAQRYETARFEAERYRTQIIPRAQRAYQLYLMKYQQMAEAYPQVLVSQRTLFQLQISYLRALENVWSSGVALQYYTLTGGLEAPRASEDPVTRSRP